MGRVSTKENKTQYQLFREELGLSRERASELIGWVSAERIEKIESEKSLPHPDEVLAMSVANPFIFRTSSYTDNSHNVSGLL